MPINTLSGHCLQCPCPQLSDPWPTLTSRGDSPRLTGRSSPTSSTLCWIPVYVSPLRVESLFHSVLWSSCPQACWSSPPSALGGFHLLMPDPQPQEPKMGLRTFTFAREPLQYNYFAVFGSPTCDVTKVSNCLFWLLLCL